MSKRELFWAARFTEKAHHKDVVNLSNHNIADTCRKYADECLVQYDITFKKGKK